MGVGGWEGTTKLSEQKGELRTTKVSDSFGFRELTLV